jgi:hypothetical protein|nr:MAG TPA: Protein of unknown function (DUF2829) [Caudoviricetes sp.]
MRFSEAIEHLLNGERIKEACWENGYYIKLENDKIVDCDGSAEVFDSKDIISNDWELYQPKLDVGAVIQYNDGTIGIVLSLSELDKEYIILDENWCVETVNESQVSLINIDYGKVSLHEDSASKNLKSIVLSLQMISELVN